VCISILLTLRVLTALTTFVLLSVQVDPSECKILLTDPPLNPTKNREKMVCQFANAIYRIGYVHMLLFLHKTYDTNLRSRTLNI
jgi:hypothetical protein